MTREEAIKSLNEINETIFGGGLKSIPMAINALEQEPCEDCIGRAEAIKALNCEISGSIESDIDLSKYKREFQEFANMILNAQEKAIQALPPVTPKPKIGHWIPVSERSPEEGQEVLVTSRSGNILDIDTSIFYHASAFWKLYVIAWMPLPEPYKAEGSSNDARYTLS